MTAPNRIKELRLAAGLTQVQAAERAGWSQRMWSHVERGPLDQHKLGTLRRAAAAIGCDVRLYLSPHRPMLPNVWLQFATKNMGRLIYPCTCH